jgi:hypothetical protein
MTTRDGGKSSGWYNKVRFRRRTSHNVTTVAPALLVAVFAGLAATLNSTVPEVRLTAGDLGGGVPLCPGSGLERLCRRNRYIISTGVGVLLETKEHNNKTHGLFHPKVLRTRGSILTRNNAFYQTSNTSLYCTVSALMVLQR